MNKALNRKLKSVLYAAILLIILGIGNILFAASKAQVYSDLYRKLLQISKEESPISPNIDMRLKRAKARLDFYKVVNMGGKSLLVISALLLLYCLYMSKDSGNTPQKLT